MAGVESKCAADSSVLESAASSLKTAAAFPPIFLYFENGAKMVGESFGASGEFVGEVVFNTSMSGYQEILSDPSYAGQFVAFSMPEIGIVGANAQDMERQVAHAKGIVCRRYNEFYSNFRAEFSLSAFLKKHGICGIAGINTRAIVSMLRQEGAMMMIASTLDSDFTSLAKKLKNAPRIEEINYIKEVSTKAAHAHKNGIFDFGAMSYAAAPKAQKKVVAIDFGAKNNILNELTNVGLEVEVSPSDFDADALIARFKKGEIHGVFLSNGPGDPLVLRNEVAQIKKLVAAKIPMFGICLGHQLLSIAHGFPTYKLKFGHHGGNHPVKNMESGEIEITAQNHNYAVSEDIAKVAVVTHRNLFDNTIEGVRYKDAPIFSLQHHPEASPGPKEAARSFADFARMLGVV